MTGYVRVDTSNNIADGNVISAADLDNEFDGIQAAFNASTGHNHDGTTGEGAPISVLGPTQDIVVSASTVLPKTTNTVDIGSSSLKFKDLFLAGNTSIAGTLAVTGVTTFTANPVMSGGTANGVAYLNGSKVLTTGSALTFDGSTFQADTSGFRIGKSPTDSPSANIYASVIAAADQTSELWLGANTVAAVGGSFLSGLGFYNTDNTTPGANLSGIKAYIKDSTGSMYLNFYAGNTYYAANTPQYTIDPAYHAWFSGTTEGMRLTSTGLGIGTSSPAYRLDVVESADSEVSLRVSNQNTGANSIASLYLHGQGNNFFIRNYGDGTSNANKTDFISAAGSSYFTFSPANAERMRIDSSGNLGLGVTPSAWATLKAVQLPGGAIAGYAGGTGNNQFSLLNNAYYDGTNYDYIVTDTAQMYRTTGGTHQWHNAPSGTAGTAITFSERMRLSAAGGLSIGTTTDPGAGGLITTGNVTLGDATTDTVTVNGYMGVGGAGGSAAGLWVRNTALTGTNQNGILVSPVGTTSGTSVAAIVTNPGTAASVYTATALYGMYVGDAVKGAGSTITTQNGITIADQTQGVSNIGLTSQVSSGSGKWNIYVTGTADNYFAGRVGFGTTSLGGGSGQYRFSGSITGATTSSGLLYTPTIQSDATANAYVFHSQPSTAAAAFTITNLVHYHATQATIGAGSTVTNQFGFNVQSTLTGATNNYGFYGGIASGTGRWNLYMAGTADNYFAGNVGIGTSSPAAKLDVSASTGAVIRMTSSADGIGAGVTIGDLQFYGNDASVPGAGVKASISAVTNNALGDDADLIFKNSDGTTNNIERMRISYAGNVGIGTSSPVGNLDVAGTTPTLNIRDTQSKVSWAAGDIVATLDFYSNDTSGVGAQAVSRIRSVADTASAATSGALAFWTAAAGAAATEKLRITSAGNVGIGITTPAYALDVVGDIQAQGRLLVTAAAPELLLSVPSGGLDSRIYNDGSGNLIFGNGTNSATPTERMRIDSSGNVLVGTTNTSPAANNVNGFFIDDSGFISLTGSGTAAIDSNRTNDGNIVAFRRAGTLVGTIAVTTTATAYNTSSDYRLKDITGPITTSGAYIDSLNPVEGTWKADGSTFVGLIAHEVQEASRTPVATGVKDGEEMQGMDYSSAEIIANLIAEVKSLRQRLAAAGI